MATPGSRRCREFVVPDFEAVECAGTERGDHGNVGGVAATSDEDAADAWRVVARIERVPLAAEIGFKPSGEVARRVGRRQPCVAEVAGAISRRDVEGAAEGDGQVGVVAADAYAFVVGFRGVAGGAGVLVPKFDAVVNEVADGLDAGPAGGRFSKQAPGEVEQFVAIAIAAGEQEEEGVVGDGFNGALQGVCDDGVGSSGVVECGGGREGDFSSRGREADAPVAEGVAIGGRGH